MPFKGELMTCCVCGKQQRSDPKVQTQWRALEIDGEIIYGCPDEFPCDGAGDKAFKTAYQLVIACGLQELIERKGEEGDPAVASYRVVRRQREDLKSQKKGFGK